jgi:hypothetical protein
MIAHRIAIERGIPLIVHGRSRSQMFRELAPGTTDIFTPLLRQNLRPYDRSHVLLNLEALDKTMRRFFAANIAEKDVEHAQGDTQADGECDLDDQQGDERKVGPAGEVAGNQKKDAEQGEDDGGAAAGKPAAARAAEPAGHPAAKQRGRS